MWILNTTWRCVLLFISLAWAPSILANATFDGVLRPTPDGRMEAYLRPPFPSNHASNLELLPDNSPVLAWFSGSKEGASGVAIVFTHLPHGSNVWNNATVVSQRPGYSNQNPVLFFDNRTQTLNLFHSQQPPAGEAFAQVWGLQSHTHGNNWTTPHPVFTMSGSFDRNRIMVSLNNTWLLPMYTSLLDYAYVEESVEAKMDGPWVDRHIHLSHGLIQPTIVRPKQGQPWLVAFFRDTRSHNKSIYRADSHDDGRTWSFPKKTTLPNNDSGIQASVLFSGNMVIVYNPTTSSRNPLVISLSEDQGSTWKYTRTLEYSNRSSEFSYPSVLQQSNGNIYVSYTYNRETIKFSIIPNEDWIKQQD